MQKTTKTAKSAQLFCQEGNHDAVYLLSIVPVRDGFTVVAEYGRRFASLTIKALTKTAVSLSEAERLFQKTIASKTRAGRDRTYQIA